MFYGYQIGAMLVLRVVSLLEFDESSTRHVLIID